MDKGKSNLDLVREVDCFPNEDIDREAYQKEVQRLYKLVWKDVHRETQIGYMLPQVAEKFAGEREDGKEEFKIYPSTKTVVISANDRDEEQITHDIGAVFRHWKSQKGFKILETWRDELWPVYHDANNRICSVERAAAGLLGVNRYGVHLTAFQRSGDGLKIWVAERSATKSTFPGMLDNTVAGGLMTGEDPLDCIVREADEEASLPKDMTRAKIVHAGSVSYIYITDERSGGEKGHINPEFQYVYDLELDPDIQPLPNDKEVEAFKLCTVDEIREQLAKGLFKPNCALVMIDFFIRHGILTAENEPDLEQIKRHIHRKMPFPGPQDQWGPKASKAPDSVDHPVTNTDQSI